MIHRTLWGRFDGVESELQVFIIRLSFQKLYHQFYHEIFMLMKYLLGAY